MGRHGKIAHDIASPAFVFCLVTGLVLPSCQDAHWRGTVRTPMPGVSSDGTVQEGKVVVHADEEVQVIYKRPFQSPPRLILLGFDQSWFKEVPYNLDQFKILQQDATHFKIRNTHPERYCNSWAVLKWKAEGIPSALVPMASCATHDQLVVVVEYMGGHITLDAATPDKPLIFLDLHDTRVTDADLAVLRGSVKLRQLNLYNTPITDVGVGYLSGLVGLQSLQLNNTAVSDAGMPALAHLGQLKELGLAHTRISDAGLAEVSKLKNLQHLTLSGTAVSDRGIAYLKELRDLRDVHVASTQISPAGVQELQRALPRLHILQ